MNYGRSDIKCPVSATKILILYLKNNASTTLNHNVNLTDKRDKYTFAEVIIYF